MPKALISTKRKRHLHAFAAGGISHWNLLSVNIAGGLASAPSRTSLFSWPGQRGGGGAGGWRALPARASGLSLPERAGHDLGGHLELFGKDPGEVGCFVPLGWVTVLSERSDSRENQLQGAPSQAGLGIFFLPRAPRILTTSLRATHNHPLKNQPVSLVGMVQGLSIDL